MNKWRGNSVAILFGAICSTFPCLPTCSLLRRLWILAVWLLYIILPGDRALYASYAKKACAIGHTGLMARDIFSCPLGRVLLRTVWHLVRYLYSTTWTSGWPTALHWWNLQSIWFLNAHDTFSIVDLIRVLNSSWNTSSTVLPRFARCKAPSKWAQSMVAGSGTWRASIWPDGLTYSKLHPWISLANYTFAPARILGFAHFGGNSLNLWPFVPACWRSTCRRIAPLPDYISDYSNQGLKRSAPMFNLLCR